MFAASPPTIEAGTGSSTITVTARDANGNLIAGATVELQATGSGNTLTQPTGPTGVDGMVTGTLRSTVAEAKAISVTINGLAGTRRRCRCSLRRPRRSRRALGARRLPSPRVMRTGI